MDETPVQPGRGAAFLHVSFLGFTLLHQSIDSDKATLSPEAFRVVASTSPPSPQVIDELTDMVHNVKIASLCRDGVGWRSPSHARRAAEIAPSRLRPAPRLLQPAP